MHQHMVCSPMQNETKVEYDKVIQETEGNILCCSCMSSILSFSLSICTAAYLKILESSQTLLTVLKREAVNIQKKKQASS